jgi:DNA-binding transcriptional LysR family regulator
MLEEITLAAPAYIEAHGLPKHPDSLPESHRMVGFHSSATGSLLPLEFTIDGKISNVTLPATVSVNAAESYIAAAKLGFGLIQIPRYHAEEALRSGELAQVLEGFPPTATPVSVLYPHNRQLSPRVRVFIDWLVHEFTSTE